VKSKEKTSLILEMYGKNTAYINITVSNIKNASEEAILHLLHRDNILET